MNPSQFYEQELNKHSALLETYKKRLHFFTFARLFSFLLIVATCYWLSWGVVLMGAVLVEVVLFVYLINRWLDIKLLVDEEKLYVELNQQELLALSGDWSNFASGQEFKSSLHPFSADMDLFGENSVFQYINRTVMPMGSQRLAETLSEGTSNPELNREMIAELSGNIAWAQQFIVQSKVLLKNKTALTKLSTIKEQFLDEHFGKRMVNYVRWLLPIITIGSIVLYNVNIWNASTVGWIALLAFLIIGTHLKSTNRWMNHLDSCSEQINVLYRQIKMFQHLELHSEQGRSFQEKLFGKMGVLEGLSQLNTIRKRTGYRMNILVGIVLNYLFAWDLHVLVQSRKWHQKYVHDIDKWEEYLAEIEVWVSGAIYRYNQEDTCFASPVGYEMKIVGLTHPFVTKNKRIVNDFTLNQDESFLIITGPNMAGKSTYLRSVGLAILSANAGFPILAQSYSMPKFHLYSSMRTSDDLAQSSSYFYAELLRLKLIATAIEEKHNVFVILDEILKGTNSHDKAIGSAQFLSKLQNMGAKGIIATHDLSLTDLAKQSTVFQNMYFDSTIEKEELLFDYKIRPGVCQNMNASYLLKKMDLI